MSLPTSLRATSDGLIRDLAALGALEDEKRTLPMDDPRVVELAEQIEVIAARVLAASERQTGLAKEVADAPVAGTSIGDVRRPPSAILEEWREAERRVAEAPDGSAEAAEGRIVADHLRREYGAAYGEANRAPKPPA
jgi:hypothetical protein